MAHIKAYLQGVVDGFEQPYDLTMGMTWDDVALNETYDKGANMGQAIGQLVGRK